jgi:SSS family solute:Na+ symporter
VILQIGAGTGLLYLVRWFWWRVTAWCEIVAMVSSFGISILFLILNKMGGALGTYKQMLITIACTTVLWVATAYWGPQTDEAALLNFYQKVRPPGPGWRHVQAIARISPEQAAADRAAWNFPMSLLGWFTGCITIWSGLFTVGNLLYGRMDYFWAMLAVFVVCGSILIRVVNRLWR